MRSIPFILAKIQNFEVSLQFSSELLKRCARQLESSNKARFLELAETILDEKILLQRERLLRETSFIMTEDQISVIRNIQFLESHLAHLKNIFPILMSYILFVEEDGLYKEIFFNKSDLIRKAIPAITKRLMVLKS